MTVRTFCVSHLRELDMFLCMYFKEITSVKVYKQSCSVHPTPKYPSSCWAYVPGTKQKRLVVLKGMGHQGVWKDMFPKMLHWHLGSRSTVYIVLVLMKSTFLGTPGLIFSSDWRSVDSDQHEGKPSLISSMRDQVTHSSVHHSVIPVCLMGC